MPGGAREASQVRPAPSPWSATGSPRQLHSLDLGMGPGAGDQPERQLVLVAGDVIAVHSLPGGLHVGGEVGHGPAHHVLLRLTFGNLLEEYDHQSG